MNEFDELFNRYFGKDKNINSINSIMKLLGHLNQDDGLSGMGPMEAGLGKPDSVREYERDGVKFIESTWNTPQGTLVRIETKDEIDFTSDIFNQINIPTGKSMREDKLTLEEKLEHAKEIEDYETCALIRDEIKARDNKKKLKKDEVLNNTKDLDNEGVDGGDDWNF